MTEYALVDPADQISRYASNVDPTVETKPGWRWLPVERTTDPLGPGQVYDPPVTTVLVDKVTVVITARDKTDAELEQDAVAMVTALDPLVFVELLNHENRLRTLEGAPTVDPTDFRVILKELLL